MLLSLNSITFWYNTAFDVYLALILALILNCPCPPQILIKKRHHYHSFEL